MNKYEILYGNAYPMVHYNLDYGEMIKCESDAMVAMSPTVDVEGKLEGGLLSGLGRVLAGEKFFFQTLTAKRGSGYVLFAPATTGAIVDLPLDGSYELSVQKDGFLGGTSGINVSTKMQNLAKGFFSKQGFFILRVGGKGTVFLNSLGAIHTIQLQAGEEIIIDNGHLVAWPSTMQFKLEKAAKGILSSITSGEGIVCRFVGPGFVMIQSRNPTAFAGFLNGLIVK
ncbi:MAG: TIGR00266 family protein [Deltaproteobacteria bacterium]|nr:TIGR00266 family protein [Deltaproteobacteria bacterium]